MCSVPDSLPPQCTATIIRFMPTNDQNAVTSSGSTNVINCVDAEVIILKIAVV